MSGDSNDPKRESAPQPSHNPEGEIPRDPTSAPPNEGRNASGEDAEAAGRRASADAPVTREEVVDQSAYKDDAADLGQQAAAAEQERRKTH